MGRTRKVQKKLTISDIIWIKEISVSTNTIVWRTELTKEFKKIWYKNRDYFTHCGFAFDNGAIIFRMPKDEPQSIKWRDEFIGRVL